MQLIHDHLHAWDQALPRVLLSVERATLAKRRWRGTALDGQEFGFDLQHPLADGDVFHVGHAAVYSVQQEPEPLLQIALVENAAGSA